MKKIDKIVEARAPHMVGDGLPVRNVFSYNDLGRKELSPFLMLDYGMPSQFAPTEKVLGVGMHPHRGFETVTFAFQGRLQHRDTAGNHGEIGPGDVQWMTAGSGVLHEELHAPSFRKTGGTLQMVQLWVNLPKAKKMTPPKYQTILNEDIPTVCIADGRAKVRVIAGTFADMKGPAETFTPMNLWDIQIDGAQLPLTVPSGYTTAIFVAEGTITVNGTKEVREPSLVMFERDGTEVSIASQGPARLLVLNGEPIEESVVGYGPFVMNTQEEIAQALNDFNSGRFARTR